MIKCLLIVTPLLYVLEFKIGTISVSKVIPVYILIINYQYKYIINPSFNRDLLLRRNNSIFLKQHYVRTLLWNSRRGFKNEFAFMVLGLFLVIIYPIKEKLFPTQLIRFCDLRKTMSNAFKEYFRHILQLYWFRFYKVFLLM